MIKLSAALVAVSCAVSVASASPLEDLAFEVQEHNHDKTSGWIVERMMTYQVGAACWARLGDKKQGALGKISGHARGVQRWAKLVTGDDWSGIESSNGDRDNHRKVVGKMIDDFKSRFHLTVIVEGDDCEATGSAMWIKMVGNAVSALEKYPPKAGKAYITVTATPKVKTVGIVVGKDGATFTITGPRDVEPSGWSDVIEKAMKRVSTKN